MGLKFRRGTTAQQSGSLAFGEPYVNTTLGTLVIGGATGDIVLSTTGTGSTGVFGVISGSALHITGNAQVGGNLTLGGAITIGDNTSDVINVVASLSSSLIPSNDNVFNIGSTSYRYANVYATTVSASAYTGLGNLTTYSTSVDSRLVAAESFSSSLDSTFATDASVTIVSASAFGAFTSASSYSASAATDLSASNAARVALSGSVKTVTDAIDTRVTTLEGKDISVTLTGDVTGTGTITDLGNVSFATTIATNSVALGTDTTGDYVASMTAGTGITVGTATGEGSTPVITNTGVTSAVAGTGVTVSAGTGAVTFSIGQAVATNSAVSFASVAATGDIVAFSSSDRRFKNNIVNISDALNKVKQLNGVTWEWNDDVNDVTKSSPKTGLIAQEVQEVLPEVVSEREDGYLGLDYSKMVGLLVEAIKEQQTQIAELKAEVEALKK